MAEPLFLIDVPFRGERDYLHSTSLFDFLTAKTGAAENVRLSINKPLRRAVAAFAGDPALPGQFTAAGIWLSIGEVDGEPPREPYDEAEILAPAVIGEGAAFHPGKGPGTVIEKLVAMNKRLLQHLGTPMFGSVRLDWPLWADMQIGVTLKRSGRGFHYSEIDALGRPVGEMVFHA